MNQEGIRIGRGEKRVVVQLWCPWCNHKHNYHVAKGDQPMCKSCGRPVPKRRYS